jgi:uncharacterized membrane protein
LLSACGDDVPAAAPDGGADAAADPDASEAAPGITFLDYLIAVDVTPDGRTAAFEDLRNDVVELVLVDTISGEARVVTEVGDPSRALATGISSDLRVSAMHGGETLHAGVWSEADGWLDLGSPFPAGCGGDIGSGFDISADGEIVVGLVWDGCAPAAYRWSGGEFTTLEILGPSNRATVISDDGTVVAGFAQTELVDRAAAVWNADGTGSFLEPPGGDTPSEVLSISADGKTLAGIRGFDGFVWTRGTGLVIMSRLDIALPTDKMFPNAIAGDGELVFGGLGDAFFGIPIAFVWTAQDGMTALADVAAASGITLPEGTLLNNVLAASTDGTVTIGTAMDAAGNPRTFVLRLPADAFVR